MTHSLDQKVIASKGYKGYKDGLQPESLADGNWLVKQNQLVAKYLKTVDVLLNLLASLEVGVHTLVRGISNWFLQL